MENSEYIITKIPDVINGFGLKDDLYITDKRIVVIDLGHGRTDLGAFGLLGGLVSSALDKSNESRIKEWMKSHTLDEVVESNPLSIRIYYDDILQIKLQDSKSWWKNHKLEVMFFNTHHYKGEKPKKPTTFKYNLSKEQFEQLYDILPKIDGLNGKLTI